MSTLDGFPNVNYCIPSGSFSLTQPEVKFLAFIKPAIDERLSKGATEIFISYREEEKKAYADWSSTNFVKVPESDIVSIVESLWGKTKVCIAQQMAFAGNVNMMKDEDWCQTRLIEIAKKMVQDKFEGELFTLRQAMWLSHVAKDMVAALD